MRRSAGLLVVAAAAACGSDGGAGDPRKPPADPTFATDTGTGAPATSSDSSSSDGGETGVLGEGDPCSAAKPCPTSTFCVAPDAGGTLVGHGRYVCTASCVETDDVSRWCLDDAACCDAAASCELGLCRGPSASDTGNGGSGESTAAGTTDSSGG